MICKKPFIQGTVPYPCGQCLPCRFNRRRLWTWRMYYESQCHAESSFVTLTYDDEHLPEGGTLVPVHYRNFLKRLRRRIEPNRIRFFAVGEYGDLSQRPHYHLAIFGLGPRSDKIIADCWNFGFVQVAEFNNLTAQYIAGYVVKKMTAKDDARLNGRHPEFARQSNRPGIGAKAMEMLAQSLHTDAGLDDFLRTGDVPTHLVMGQRSIPLGRYLRQKLREEMGVPLHVQQASKDRRSFEASVEMLSLLADSIFDKKPIKKKILEINANRIASLEGREKLYAAKRSQKI